MWTEEQRAIYRRDEDRYPNNLTDTEWKQLKPLIPEASLRGHYAYYGIGGNIRALFKVYRAICRRHGQMMRHGRRMCRRISGSKPSRRSRSIRSAQPMRRVPEDTPLATLVDYAKLRWRIERDYEELKGELGLSHYEGRGWRGFHHHATLCIAAYGFLISERDAIPPSASRRRTMPRLPDDYRPRGAADPSRTPRRKLDRDDQKTPHRRARKIPRAMSMLSVDAPTACNPIAFMNSKIR